MDRQGQEGAGQKPMREDRAVMGEDDAQLGHDYFPVEKVPVLLKNDARTVIVFWITGQ